MTLRKCLLYKLSNSFISLLLKIGYVCPWGVSVVYPKFIGHLAHACFTKRFRRGRAFIFTLKLNEMVKPRTQNYRVILDQKEDLKEIYRQFQAISQISGTMRSLPFDLRGRRVWRAQLTTSQLTSVRTQGHRCSFFREHLWRDTFTIHKLTEDQPFIWCTPTHFMRCSQSFIEKGMALRFKRFAEMIF